MSKRPPKPSVIYIGGIRYLFTTPKKVDRDDNLGQVNYLKKTIKVRRGAGQITLNTVIHEVIHASAYENTSHVGLRGLDEKDVDVIANGVAGALRQLGMAK